MPPGYFVVDLLAASGVPLPGDAMPAGGTGNMFGPILVRPGQLAFGIIEWAADLRKVAPPQQLVFAIGGDPHPSRPISLSVGDVDVPAHPQSPDAQRPLRSGAYGRFTSVADPAALASLTATVIAPGSVAAGSTLRYTVVLANLTDTSVPLASCPEFDESVTLVPQKTPVSVTAGGPLNCARLPPAIAPGGAVTLQLEMRVAAEPVGAGSLTWHLHDGARAVLTGYTAITVRQ